MTLESTIGRPYTLIVLTSIDSVYSLSPCKLHALTISRRQTLHADSPHKYRFRTLFVTL